MEAWRQVRNLLVVRLDNTGDVVMLGPALRALRTALPTSRITLLASPAGATAAALLPTIDAVISWRVVWQDLGKLPLDPQREQQLIGELASHHFDAAIIFTSFSQTPHTPAYACYLAGIPLRAGESKEFGGSVLTTALPPAPDDLHQVERNLRLVEALGFAVADRHLAVALPPSARAAVPRLLATAGLAADAPFILVHPGASAVARRYPPQRMGALARELLAQGHQVLVGGVEREAELVAIVCAQAPGAAALVGTASLAEYAALVEQAQLVICGNTLPLHLADALGTPVLGLYSGTDYESQWQPRFVEHRLLRRATPCAPCYLFNCPIGLVCLDVAPATAAATAQELLAAKRLPAGRLVQEYRR